MIERETLEQMFANIRSKTKWNIDGPMLWGYFFTGSSQAKLQAVGDLLAGIGYRFVEVRPVEEKNYFQLHIEKVEPHTVESLFERNGELQEVADEFLVEYDGMDVGPVIQ